MNAISREHILSKTHYGLNIYSHILRLYYPDEVVLRLTGRDCGISRNPFNSNKETLHISIEQASLSLNPYPIFLSCGEDVRRTGEAKERPGERLARHEDSENAIPAGDAFDFAELHYKQQGDELLQTLNKELFLHIGEKKDTYTKSQKYVHCSETSQPKSLPFGEIGGASFSFFKAPITNTKPHKTVSLLQIYNAIVGDYYKDRTEKLRAILAAPSLVERAGERLPANSKPPTSTTVPFRAHSQPATTKPS